MTQDLFAGRSAENVGAICAVDHQARWRLLNEAVRLGHPGADGMSLQLGPALRLTADGRVIAGTGDAQCTIWPLRRMDPAAVDEAIRTDLMSGITNLLTLLASWVMDRHIAERREAEANSANVLNVYKAALCDAIASAMTVAADARRAAEAGQA